MLQRRWFLVSLVFGLAAVVLKFEGLHHAGQAMQAIARRTSAGDADRPTLGAKAEEHAKCHALAFLVAISMAATCVASALVSVLRREPARQLLMVPLHVTNAMLMIIGN